MRVIQGKEVLDGLKEVVAPAHTALIVVDLQNDFLDPDGAYAKNGEDIGRVRGVLGPIVELIEVARQAGVLVVYTRNTTLPYGRSDSAAWLYFKNYARPNLAGSYTLAGSWGHALVPELSPRSDEPIVEKHRSDAFVGTDLDQLLRAAGTRTTVVLGVVTNGCVEATVRHAAFLDYYSVVVEDCCASTNATLHEAALTLLRGRHDVVRADDIRKVWESHG